MLIGLGGGEFDRKLIIFAAALYENTILKNS
ncbi:hypothetical protein SAMN05428975_3767 [Mucilaginibacter sp. OK268]|nr:hypothetical protein SAMN05428975_3767 [Mucilaginibacter sp. OK268]